MFEGLKILSILPKVRYLFCHSEDQDKMGFFPPSQYLIKFTTEELLLQKHQ